MRVCLFTLERSGTNIKLAIPCAFMRKVLQRKLPNADHNPRHALLSSRSSQLRSTHSAGGFGRASLPIAIGGWLLNVQRHVVTCSSKAGAQRHTPHRSQQHPKARGPVPPAGTPAAANGPFQFNTGMDELSTADVPASSSGVDPAAAAAAEDDGNVARDGGVPVSPRKERVVKVPAAVRGTGAKALLSVLKVFVVRTDPNYAQAWQMLKQRSSTGSAFVISTQERLILTNSHVTSNATTIHVRRPGNPKKWKARLLCDGRVCDLAVVTVDDDAFWGADPKLEALRFVDVPELQDSMLVAGYPLGGDSLSITQGIVSRITMTQYAKAWDNTLLGIQIDAAINPGNSGGPAFSSLQRGEVAGVAFSKLVHADNIGYIIPSPVVSHFLDEFRTHGTYRGAASMGFRWEVLENNHMREYLRVPEAKSGILIYAIEPLSPAAQALQPNDVLLELDGVPVADDGTVQFRNEERVGFLYVVRSKHVGDDIRVKLWRDGKELSSSYPLARSHMLVPSTPTVDCVPSYFVVGGLVFLPLTLPFLEHAYGSDKWRKNGPLTVTCLLWEYQQQAGQQVVVLYQVLSHEINFGYRVACTRCESFNGTTLVSLRHLTELVDACNDRYLHFGLEGGRAVVLDREAAAEHGPRILQQHAIADDRSPDLRAPPTPTAAAAAAAAAAADGGGGGGGGGAANSRVAGGSGAGAAADGAAAEMQL